jgi:hypothetical protein
VSQLVEVVGPAVGKIVLAVVPDSFVRIELGRVWRKSLDVKPRMSTHEIPYHFSLVDVSVVPQHDQAAPQVPQKLSEKTEDFEVSDAGPSEQRIQPHALTHRTDSDSRDRRQSESTKSMSQDRRLASRRPGLHYGRQQREA